MIHGIPYFANHRKRLPNARIAQHDFESHGFIRLIDDDLVLLPDAHYIRIAARGARDPDRDPWISHHANKLHFSRKAKTTFYEMWF